ncbi:MAG: hypothetical protein KDD73_15155 [Anaerolineales bacterium]|nr:hypothetical protein [Anaerolineales bacterium]MCB9128496.1 hypothetical protein [Ardenticatenales bacterium]
MTRQWLRDQLSHRFNLDELRTLCFDLAIPYENLAGSTLSAKARELVTYCERHHRTDDLVALLREQRPDLFADAALPQRKRDVQAALTSDGATAQGTGNIVLGAGAVYIGGNVERSQLVQGNQNRVGDEAQRGGIRVGKIVDSENVTIGGELKGGNLADAAALAERLMNGSISVEEVVRSKHIMVGLRHVADPAAPTLDALRQEIAALRDELTAIRDSEALDAVEAEDAEEAAATLATVATELDKEAPRGSRVLRKLKELTTLLTSTAEAGESAEKVGGQLVKLAPVAAALYQLAQRLLGG